MYIHLLKLLSFLWVLFLPLLLNHSFSTLSLFSWLRFSFDIFVILSFSISSTSSGIYSSSSTSWDSSVYNSLSNEGLSKLLGPAMMKNAGVISKAWIWTIVKVVIIITILIYIK